MYSDFMAYANDEDSLSTLLFWAERQGFHTDSVRQGGSETFGASLETSTPPKVVFVDFDDQEEPVHIAARLVSLCGPAAKIVGIGSANDVTLYRNMLAAGVVDYLVKPLSPDILTQTMLLAGQENPAAGRRPPRRETRNILILGVRGGVGASTIATNVAWILAHEQKRKTLLMDLDLYFGTSALALDLEPGHGLRDIVSSPQRVDNLMIAGAIVNESESFSVLSAEESIEDILTIDPHAVMALIKEIKVSHQAVVIDLPRYMIPQQKRILATAHEIVLVTEMSLVGIRDTLRLRTTLKSLGAVGRITQVASRVTHPAAVDEATFAKGAGAKIDFIIPEDTKNIIAASNSGKTLATVAPGAPSTGVMKNLARHLLGDEDKESGKKNPLRFLNLLSSFDRKEAEK